MGNQVRKETRAPWDQKGGKEYKDLKETLVNKAQRV
jgi:hypothetical protein